MGIFNKKNQLGCWDTSKRKLKMKKLKSRNGFEEGWCMLLRSLLPTGYVKKETYKCFWLSHGDSATRKLIFLLNAASLKSDFTVQIRPGFP